MRNFLLKQMKSQWLRPLLQKVLLVIFFAMLSSNLYAQRWRCDYEDIAPTPWWLCLFIVIVFSFYLWMKKSKRFKKLEIKQDAKLKTLFIQIIKCLLYDIRDNPINSVATIAALSLYTIMLLYQWAFYVFIILLCLAALSTAIYIRWGDNINDFIIKLKK